MIWGMFTAVTMESAVFMGKNYQKTQFTLKQMFNMSTRLVAEQDEISGLETTRWENHSWKYLSLIGDERVINLQRTKVYVFSHSVLSWQDIRKFWISRSMGAKIWTDQIFSKLQKLWQDRWGANGIRVEYFPRIQYVAVQWRSQKFTVQIRRNAIKFHRKEFYLWSMFNDISCGTKDNERECLASAKVVSFYAKKFGMGQWPFIGHGSEKKWYSMEENSPQGIWDHIAEKMLLEFAESTCPIFRATTPLSRVSSSERKGYGKLSIHFAADSGNNWNCFSHNCFCKSAQFLRSSRGTCVKSMNSLHERTGATC